MRRSVDAAGRRDWSEGDETAGPGKGFLRVATRKQEAHVTRRLIALLTLGVFTALLVIVVPPFTGAHASISHQAAASATATSTTGATATVGTALATSTVAPTATSVPLAAYPAPLTFAAATRSGKVLTFRWTVLTKSGIKGFNLYAGTHRLNATMIKTHAALTYHKSVPYRKGRPALRILYRSGTYATVRL
jgi:hypothetical protein